MANIDRVRVSLTGFVGAPGVATHYGLNGPGLFGVVRALWQSLAGAMPDDVTIKVENFGDTINDVNGSLVGSWSIADEPAFQGVDTGVYAAPAGVLLTWLTADILDRKRIRGRTFVVPAAASNYEANGTLVAAALGNFRQYAATYATNTAGNAVIWHRPIAARAATPTSPARAQRNGGHAVITGSRVSDMVAVLRSRRD